MISVGIVSKPQFPHRYQYAFISGADIYPFESVGCIQGPCSCCPKNGPVVKTTAIGRHAVDGLWERKLRPIAYCNECKVQVIENPKNVMFKFLLQEFPVLPRDIWDLVMDKV